MWNAFVVTIYIKGCTTVYVPLVPPAKKVGYMYPVLGYMYPVYPVAPCRPTTL